MPSICDKFFFVWKKHFLKIFHTSTSNIIISAEAATQVVRYVLRIHAAAINGQNRWRTQLGKEIPLGQWGISACTGETVRCNVLYGLSQQPHQISLSRSKSGKNKMIGWLPDGWMDGWIFPIIFYHFPHHHFNPKCATWWHFIPFS